MAVGSLLWRLGTANPPITGAAMGMEFHDLEQGLQ